MRENPDKPDIAESRSSIGEDEAAIAQPGTSFNKEGKF